MYTQSGGQGTKYRYSVPNLLHTLQCIILSILRNNACELLIINLIVLMLAPFGGFICRVNLIHDIQTRQYSLASLHALSSIVFIVIL